METAIILNSDTLGRGSEDLGEKLMGSYLRKLWTRTDLPETIICYNAGVKLMAKGSSVLDALHGLAEKGVDIIACGTCVDYYELRQSIEVGRISNMDEIVSVMSDAKKVITV